MGFSKYHRVGVGRELFELFSPSTVKAMMDTINNGAIVLSRDMETQASPSLKMSFGLFKANWDTFYADNQGWFARSLNTTYDMVEGFGRQLDTYRRQLIDEGGHTSIPAIKERKGSIEVSPAGLALTAAAGALLFLFLRR